MLPNNYWLIQQYLISCARFSQHDHKVPQYFLWIKTHPLKLFQSVVCSLNNNIIVKMTWPESETRLLQSYIFLWRSFYSSSETTKLTISSKNFNPKYERLIRARFDRLLHKPPNCRLITVLVNVY